MTAKFQLEASLHDLSGGVAPQWWTLCESGTKRQVAAFYADVDSADELARLVNGVAAESQAIASDRAALTIPKWRYESGMVLNEHGLDIADIIPMGKEGDEIGRLVASAPDLMAFVEDVAKALDTVSMFPRDRFNDMLIMMYRTAVTLIARAKGV